jgi:hypothetical protein
MDRITRQEPVAAVQPPGLSVEMFEGPAILAGAAALAVASLVPAPGGSWLSNLWPSAGLVRTAGISAYLAQHPPWVVPLAGAAALLIVVGLAMPERQGREDVRCGAIAP